VNFTGTVMIDAPLQKVWDNLTDPNVVSQCAPGLQSMDVIVPDKQFKVVASIGFGAVKISFDVDVEWLEKEAPNYAKVKAHGKAPGSGVDVSSDMRLTSLAESSTELKWSADVVVVGTIASMASRMMEGLTRQMSNKFFDCIKGKIEA
jgi:uncharacterized protein